MEVKKIPSQMSFPTVSAAATGLRRRYTPKEMKIARNIFKNIKETTRQDMGKLHGFAKPRIERPFMLGI